MEVIIFIGLQGAGKSTFYRERLLNTHIRINLDMLKTRHREQIFLKACLEAKQAFIIDNTNPTPQDRSRYILPAKENKFRVIAYYFDSHLEECKQRNSQRTAKEIVPLVGLIGTYKKLVLPTWEEGFDEIYSVRTDINNSFTLKEWQQQSP
ncbi:MAG: ATP-binding protein [Calothrix sp. C42_A2020_038]|nr:ATP-binding protein [Calothrix sp. C42_A2020_038]